MATRNSPKTFSGTRARHRSVHGAQGVRADRRHLFRLQPPGSRERVRGVHRAAHNRECRRPPRGESSASGEGPRSRARVHPHLRGRDADRRARGGVRQERGRHRIGEGGDPPAVRSSLRPRQRGEATDRRSRRSHREHPARHGGGCARRTQVHQPHRPTGRVGGRCVVNIGHNVEVRRVYLNEEHDLVSVTYRGRTEDLIAAGVATAEMLAPGNKGRPKLDAEGDRLFITRGYSKGQRTMVRVRLAKPIERALNLPGFSIAPLLERFRRPPATTS
jgi:hypothetical protein